MSLFSKIRNKIVNQPEGDLDADPSIRVDRKAGMAVVDLDSFSSKSKAEVFAELASRSGLDVFNGSIEHGYSKAFAGQTDTCPRCKSPTQQNMANLIYTTDVACRVMLAPAGYFCQACPSVIVDEKIIAAGAKRGFRYRRVVGIDYFEKKAADYFTTWNGEKPIYVLDENEQMMDMVLKSEMRAPSASAPARARENTKKSKAKRKQADAARRRNRKK
jgi:hypothetical protein